MISRISPFFALFLVLFLAPFSVLAQDAGDKVLHVLRPVMHAEQDVAELCLEFDHALVTGDHTKVAMGLHLESDGKSIPLSQKSVSISGNDLCIPTLQHQKEYHLTLDKLHAAGGEKLVVPYTLSFTVPSRRPTLVFVNNARNNGMMRWTDDGPVLRAVNVTKVKLELFRITDPARMAEAWAQRLQTTLVPSESATFAHTNGTLAWQGDLTFDKTADEIHEQQVMLDSKTTTLPQGLYLIIASAPDMRRKETDLAPIAATWLLHSDLRVQAVRDGATVHVLADNVDAAASAKDVHVAIVNRGQQTIVDGKTGDDGVASLTIPDDKRNDATALVASNNAGDVDFVDLAQAEDAAVLPFDEAAISLSKAVYAPGEMVDVALSAHDIHGAPVATKGSLLQLMRPEGGLYASYPVPNYTGIQGHVSFATPVNEGVWTLAWKQADGRLLADGKMRVSSNPAAPHVDVIADRTLLDDSGEVNLTLKSIAGSGASQPYVSGHIFVQWGVPDHLFPGWQDYKFGTGTIANGQATVAAFFVTDSKGVAHAHLKLAQPDGDLPIRAATLSVVSDPVTGALNPPDVVLPVKPKDFVVGIKPLAIGGKFPEDGLAQFDVVVLDNNGKRSDADDLTYHIYEQGRSFDWYQADGHWQYKPLQQQRRLGGGPLLTSDDGKRHVEWPVAAGIYQLEVTDADGNRFASMEFSAGWGATKTDQMAPAKLDLTLVPPTLKAGHDEVIHFKLPKPSIVTAIVSDDHVRKIIHASMPQGENQISFVPQNDWGARLRVHVDVLPADNLDNGTQMSGDTIIASQQEAEIAPKAPEPAAKNTQPVATASTVTLDSNAQQLHIISDHILSPKTPLTIGAGKTAAKTPTLYILVGAEPFYNTPAALSAVLGQYPMTSTGLAGQLDVIRLWHDVIVETHLLSGPALQNRQSEILTRLMERQQTDGGFAALPGQGSDMLSTSAAVMSLSQMKGPAVTPVLDQATGWLRHNLENTWFEEKDRPVRAAAYAALASADALDVSSLRYFGDSSANKLSPLAATQLASAYAHINDKGSAGYWLNAARAGASDGPSPELLAWQTANPFFAVRDAKPALEKLGALAGKKSLSLGDSIALLRAVWHLQDRAGNWHASFNGAEKNANNIAIVSVPLNLTIINMSSNPLYGTEVNVVAEQSKASITRHFYRPDGGEALGNLRNGETYLVTLEGNWPGDEKSLVVHDDVGPALRPVGCALEGAGSDGFLAWLSELTPVRGCESADDALDVTISKPENGAANWRIAYMARAVTAGTFDLSQPVAVAQPDAGAPVRGRADHIVVR